MKRSFLRASLYAALSFCSSQAFAQVGIGTTTPSPNAVLELKAPGNNQGFLVPRLTTAQRTAGAFTSNLGVGDNGLLVFDSDLAKFFYWQTTAWIQVDLPQDLNLSGSILTVTNNPNATPVNLSAFTGTNTDDQTLSYNVTNGQLTITRLLGNQTITITPVGTAGGDLTGTYPNPAVANSSITSAKILDATIATADLADGSVTSAKVVDGTLTNADVSATAAIAVTKVAAGSNGQVLLTNAGVPTWSSMPGPTGTAGGDLTGSYPNPTIVNNAIISAKILDGTIATIDILDGAISTAKIADVAVSTLKLADNAVSSAKILDGTVATIDILDGAISTAKIADNAVTSAKILDGAVATADILDGAVNTIKVADNAVTSAKILDGAIGSADILDGAVATIDIVNNAVTNGKIADNAVNSIKIADGSVATADILDGAITTVKIADLGVTTAKINDAAITGIKIADGGVTTTKLVDLGVTTIKLADNAITSAKIADLTIATGDIATDAVNSAKIADGTIVVADIADGGVSTAKILDGTIIDVDLSAIANISVSKLAPSALPGQVLTTVGTATQWATVIGTGTVTSILTGTGLTGGPITTAGTISIANNGVTSTQLQSDALLDINRAVNTNHIRDGAVNSAKISDGTLINADVSATAAVAVSKLAAGTNTEVLTTVAGVPTWQAPADNSATNELQTLSGVLGQGNNAGTQSAVNFSAISINRADTPGALNVNGAHYTGFTALGLVANYAVTPNDYLIIGTATGGVTTIVTLPDASSNIGRILILRGRSVGSVSAAGVRVQAATGDTIDGVTITPFLTPVTNNPISITIVAISANEWITISKSVF